MISLIAAVGKNRELGMNNQLIWHIPEDMKFFKEMTIGHTVVMGRNTYLSLPGPLKDRRMMVLTKDRGCLSDDIVTYCYDIDEIKNKYKNIDEELFVIGGASIYQQFIDDADLIYLTEIDDECMDADSYFPLFDKNNYKRVLIKSNNYNGLNFEICKYIRK